ncbi:hypothetical protein ACF0H5_014203 [Mactra antiquata]
MNISAGYIIYGLILLRGVTDSKANRHYHFSKWIKTSKTKNAGVYVFDWQLRLSVSQCMKVCNVTKACQFFNYETRPHLCGLIRIDESSKVEVEQKPGYVYGNKSEWTQNAANICDKCNDTGRCNNDDLTDKKNDVCRNSDLRILHMGIWIGGNDIDEEGIWRWSDSSLIDNWIGENPSNTGGYEHCAEVVVAKVFKYAWNDNKCSVKKPFICEIE